MARSLLLCLLILMVLPLHLFAAVACGGPTPCRVLDGNYRIELPKDGDIRGAYVFFHGYKSSAELQMQQRPLVDTTLSHHLAYIAVDGIDGSWAFPHSARPGRDEKTFIASVFDDLRQRYGFMPDKTIVGGFSIGASMAWYTACQQGDKAAAMVTFSGVFWDPLPRADDCIADIPPIIHFHGTADQTFPLAGRSIGANFHQGNAYDSMAILRARAKCDVKDAKAITLDGIKCDDVPGCIRGDSIMCIHAGGHEAPADMLDAGLTAIGFPR
ncbi:poly(3-hydroxybutyrate) depolymerase [Rhizobium sp. P40RR-XXII]|uniref:alpha/beta hydrolase family esterase n=1 Tax=Rhizobium sp. P40RR-XXII TaxID=2726739 RepID=UPI0014576A21|nr:poly(3-hydroxybutyrate) depolymerase [Rhizobium sp. P40RR-XXII]NLS18655.1 poly(3-hydroxybutyrate) depolymerase [Rhizobium sp. P40RR-XXII]